MSSLSLFVTGASADPSVQTIAGLAEAVEAGSIITVDTATAALYEATSRPDLFGQRDPTVGTSEVLDATTGTTGSLSTLCVLADGSRLMSASSNQHYCNGNPVYRLAPDGTLLAKLTGVGGVHCLLADGHWLVASNVDATTISIRIYDQSLTLVSGPTNVGFTVSSSPLGSPSIAAIRETGTGKLMLLWWTSTGGQHMNYAVLNADFSVATQPTSADGGGGSSYEVVAATALSSGRVVVLWKYWNNSVTQLRVTHATSDGATVATLNSLTNTFGSYYPCGSASSTAGTGVYLHEIDGGTVAFAGAYADVHTLFKLTLATNTVSSVGCVGTSGVIGFDWFVAGAYAFAVWSISTGPYTVSYKPVPLAAWSSLSAVSLFASTAAFRTRRTVKVGSDYVLFGNDVDGLATWTTLMWVAVAVSGGALTVRWSQKSLASVGQLVDAVADGGGDILFLTGGTGEGTSFIPLKMGRIRVSDGALAEAALTTIRQTWTSGKSYISSYGVDYKLIHRSSGETAVLVGYVVDALAAVGPYRMAVKPVRSVVLGAATEAAAAGQPVKVKLSGWASLLAKYTGLFKSIDHTADGGNAAKVYGATAVFKGGF